MSCTYYQNDTLEQLSEKEQTEHLKTCSLCQERRNFEEQILKKAGQLEPFKPDVHLWRKIESSIINQTKSGKNKMYPRILNPKIWLSFAAVFIALLSVSVFYFFSGNSGKILSEGALVRVELTEQNYLKAIEDLEQQATPKLVQLEIDLMLLYRDKLETIDIQIKRCRKAIENNPGNAHIRRYMLAALQDKKETLFEILEI